MKQVKVYQATRWLTVSWSVMRCWLAGGLTALFFMHAMTGCNTHTSERPAKIANHTFSFAPQEGVEILEFRYGDGKTFRTSSEDAIRMFGKSTQSMHINATMPVGDSLYVKWRDKATAQEYQDTVDLKALLPNDMDNQNLYFLIQEKKLYVYLTDRNKLRPDNVPIVGPFKSQFWITRQIYPQ
jgi:hypothetical protein